MTIRNPLEWAAGSLGLAGRAIGSAGGTVYHREEAVDKLVPAIHPITMEDVREALAMGWRDFTLHRTDVIFLCLIYPVVGLFIGHAALDYRMLPLLFPLASGFALVGPFAALFLYEMSRQQERGVTIGWMQSFRIFASPSLGGILGLGAVLLTIFFCWLGVADLIYRTTLGAEPPESLSAFIDTVFTTAGGWTMIVIGMGVGFFFALLVLALSVISFPLLLDRHVGIDTAVWTSLRVFAASPGPMLAWGAIVAGLLVAGSIPLLIGLAVTLPILGHATWHLYRKTVG
ncbi:DUF2189 domain-containing protein [Radicibacter daui]|uniref:DUF2189 domain-containing protein n=1 Tax=Radicibacter daui TaxID=3064829 RepID=UPI00404689CB